MWFHRIIAWVKALFSAPMLDDTVETNEARNVMFEGMAPPSEPEFTRRELFYPRDSLKTFGVGSNRDSFALEPPLYESPKTIPLMRLSPQMELRHDEPTPALPVSSEPPVSPPVRDSGQLPGQPVVSEPLSASLQRLGNLPDSLDPFDQMDDLDDLTRRLLFLRRLVRQRVYNEGFTVEETPEQYRHSLGLGDEGDPTGSQN